MVNRQIGVEHTKNVIVFDPLLMGHVIRRMRSGRVRIFNGNQWKTLYLTNQERIGMGYSNVFLTQGRALFSQITLITFIVEPPKCIVNRQIRVGDSKNVIVYDPLLAGHVIWHMRSSSVCIFNGNQRETL